MFRSSFLRRLAFVVSCVLLLTISLPMTMAPQAAFAQTILSTKHSTSMVQLLQHPRTSLALGKAPQITNRLETTNTCTGAANDNSTHFWVKAGQAYSTQGAGANFSQPLPYVDQNDQEAASIAEMGVFDRTDLSNGWQDIEMGWIVDPVGFGDKANPAPHLFVFTFCMNGGKLDGCYVSRAKPCGYVPLSGAKYYPGDKVTVTNTPQTYAVLHYKGNWFIQYQHQYIGYFPDSHWNNTFTQINLTQWWGEVASHSDNPCVWMGNGLFGHQDNSAVIKDMSFIEGNGGPIIPAHAQIVQQSQQAAWDAGHYPSPPNTFNSFTYGGPGAACGPLNTILTPNSGPSGTKVTAQGSNWLDGNSRPGDQICIWWDTVNNVAVACTTLGQDGTWTANFTVPANQSKGQHLVRIDDQDAPLTTDTVTFTVT